MKDNSPRWDNWHVRLPVPEDQRKAIDLFQKSGTKTKSDFVRARLLGEPFKVITVDKSAVDYLTYWANPNRISELGLSYFSSTLAPASSIAFFRFSASSLDMPSFKVEGTPSTRSLASFKPRPQASLTALTT